MKIVQASDALRYMMQMHKHELARMKGQPPQGQCADCKKDVPAHEIAVKCDRCDNTYVCIRCVDKHDHIHAMLKSMGLGVVGSLRA